MQIFPECYECITRMAGSAMRVASVNETDQARHLRAIDEILRVHDPGIPPPFLARKVFDHLHSVLGVEDLYEGIKQESHQLAILLYERLKGLVSEGEDPFLEAIKIAATGNIIDVSHTEDYDLWDEVVSQVSQPILGGKVDQFREDLQKAEFLLYLADNVGETVFDRVLIEQLEIPVVYAVKSGPAMNDATREYAVAAEIDQIAEIVETGSTTPGTFLPDCSTEFRELFNRADLVLSKGQANFETLDDQGSKVYFLLRTKCPIVAGEIGYPVKRLVLARG